jgi:hypothetical protein
MRKAKWTEITDSQPTEIDTCTYEVIAETWDGYRSQPVSTEPILRQPPRSADPNP